LPKPMQESAFLDRLCAFIPGWELHPIRPDDLSTSYGLMGDFFSDILHSLRKKSFIPEIEEMITFKGNKIRQRDINLMKSTASGLIKILFPNGDIEFDDWTLIGQFAVEMRQRVIDHLAYIDSEFKNIKLKFQLTQ
ncbi:MAG: BREX system Lon protease-like protein BrxL, partial [Promethearchaeota archaeon]